MSKFFTWLCVLASVSGSVWLWGRVNQPAGDVVQGDSCPVEVASLIQDEAQDSVVHVYYETPVPFNPDRFNAWGGTGWFVAENYIVTNHHVVELALAYQVPVEVSFEGQDRVRAEVVASYAPYDLALLRTNEAGDALGVTTEIKVGDPVYSVGYRGGQYTYLEGKVLSVNVEIVNLDTPAGVTNLKIGDGNSGGPVFNCFGDVVGVSVASGQGEEVHIPSATVIDFIDRYNNH